MEKKKSILESKDDWTDETYVQYNEYVASNHKQMVKAVEKVLFEHHYNHFKAQVESGAEPTNAYKAFAADKCRKLVTGTRNIAMEGYFWLTFTINPGLFKSADEQLPRLQKKIAKLNSKKCVLRSIWNLELTDKGVPHSHYLIELNPDNPISKDKFESGVLNTFKDVGYVKMKICPQSQVSDKIEYLKGNKWDEDKQVMVLHDREWRQTLGLEEIYTHGIPWPDSLLDGPAPVVPIP